MDFSLITSAVEAVRAATSLGKAALAQRDASLVTAQVSQVNDLLLQAQERLFTHSAQLLALQQEHFQATQELRELKEALAERGRYTLVELGQGQFAYRVNVAPEGGGTSEPRSAESAHYVCQQCFDGSGKLKVVLQRRAMLYGGYCLWCPSCKTELVSPQQ